MDIQIRTSYQAVTNNKSTLDSGVSEYTQFAISDLGASCTAPGNSIHDGAIKTAVSDAVAAWAQLIQYDLETVSAMNEGISEADASVASALGGGGAF